MDLGTRIASLRQKRDLNQSELARLLGLTPQAVQAWEKGGGIRPDKFEPLATALGVSVAELLLGDEAPSQPARLHPPTLAASMMVLRKAYKRVDRVYDLETEPEQFRDTYEALQAMAGGASPENVIDISDIIADRLRNPTEKRGEQRKGRAVGGDDRGPPEQHHPAKTARAKAR